MLTIRTRDGKPCVMEQTDATSAYRLVKAFGTEEEARAYLDNPVEPEPVKLVPRKAKKTKK